MFQSALLHLALALVPCINVLQASSSAERQAGAWYVRKPIHRVLRYMGSFFWATGRLLIWYSGAPEFSESGEADRRQDRRTGRTDLRVPSEGINHRALPRVTAE